MVGSVGASYMEEESGNERDNDDTTRRRRGGDSLHARLRLISLHTNGHRWVITDKQTADNSLGPFGHTTLSSDGDGADLSPAAPQWRLSEQGSTHR